MPSKADQVLQVAQIFRSEKATPPLPMNAAPYSGAVIWLRSLRSRIMGESPCTPRHSTNLARAAEEPIMLAFQMAVCPLHHAGQAGCLNVYPM